MDGLLTGSTAAAALPVASAPGLRGAPRLLQAVWSVEREGRTAPADERAMFERRVHAAWPDVVRLVERLLAWPGSASDVEDVVQDVFLAAWRGRRTFRGEAEWTTWLHTIAVRRTRNAARGRTRRQRWFGRPDSDAVGAAAGSAGGTQGLESGSGSGSDVSVGVRDGLARLRHADREVLVLRYLESHDVEAIAERLGLRRAAVDARLSRARNRLAALMERGDREGDS
ncbi:MAG: RNA polymerase sigma factor [Planctomycetota bacterium]